MIVPIEIFNEIAEYYINSFDDLCIILSLSREIQEYLNQFEIIKRSDDYDRTKTKNKLTFDSEFGKIKMESFLIFPDDDSFERFILCSIKLATTCVYVYNYTKKSECMFVDASVDILADTHEIYRIVDGNDVQFLGLVGLTRDHEYWSSEVFDIEIMEVLYANISNSHACKWTFTQDGCKLTMDEMNKLRGDYGPRVEYIRQLNIFDS